MDGELRVRVMGEFGLDGVDLATLRSRKARTVLKILALAQGRAVSADRLIDAVWPVELPSDPERDLAVLVSRVRAVVGADRVERRDGGYALRVEWYDRAELEAMTRQAAQRQAQGDPEGARSAAEAALALATDPLLADEPVADWASGPRAASASIVAEARGIAGAAALALGEPFDAIVHGRAALEHDPYDEAALRIVMAAHVATGRPASALAEYGSLRRRLADDLGVSPAPETAALHMAILRGDPQRPRRRPAAPAQDRPFVGRHQEMTLLDEALRRATLGAVVVDVVGESGVGKTALLSTWAHRARASGATVLAATAERGNDLALAPITGALAGTSSIDEFASSVASLPAPLGTAAALRLGAYAVVADALRRVTPAAGLTIVIDDVHHADPVTRDWLGHVLRQPAAHRFLVIVARTRQVDLVIASSEVLELGPLDEAAARELVGRERAAALWARTGGNPLLLTELASVVDGELPDSVRAAVASRLRSAGGAAPTMRAAAVLGPTVDVELLADVLDVAVPVVLEHVDEGHRQSFLVEQDGVTRFRHEVVRDAIAIDTTAPRRAWLHRQAARILASRADGDPLEVAEHARHGGDRRIAAESLALAADIARSRFDLPGAEHLLDDAIALADGAPLRLHRSRVRMARDDIDGAEADAVAALGAGAGAAALELRAWAARNRHDMESAIRLGRAGAAMTDESATRCGCLLAVALAQRGIGDLRAAELTMTEVINAARPGDKPALTLDGRGLEGWLGVLRVHQGRPGEALAALEPLIGAEAGDPLSFWVEHVLQMAAHAHGHMGRVGPAFALLDHLDRELERRGSGVRYAGLTCTYRSWLLRNLAAPGAEDQARAGIERGTSNEVKAQSMLDLADTLLLEGRSDEAASALADAVGTMEARWFHNRWRAEQRAGVIDARLLLDGGDAAGALAAAERVVSEAAGRGDVRYETIATVVAGRAAARLRAPLDAARLETSLLRLGAVAAPEAWWLAGDLADETGSAVARSVAEDVGRRLVVDAGAHGASLRSVLARRYG